MAYKTENMNAIRDRVKRVMGELNLSVNAIAKALEVNTSNLYKQIKKDSPMNLSRQTLKILSMTYGVSLEWLEDGVGEMFGGRSAEELMHSFDTVFKAVNGDNSPNVTQQLARGADRGSAEDTLCRLLMEQVRQKDKEIERLNDVVHKLVDIIRQTGGK